MTKTHFKKLTLAAIALFLMVSCSKDDASAETPAETPVANLPKVTIGTQIWQTTNLDVSTYRDGTVIPEVTDDTAWTYLTTGAWCYYSNETANGITYGKLYNWYAVAGIHDSDPNTPNKVLAPSGWHVPSDAEWTTLIDFLGGSRIAGDKMKATGTTLWITPNTDATNSSGFTGLPGGCRIDFVTPTFSGIGFTGAWWSSTEKDIASGSIRSLIYNESYIQSGTNTKTRGFSVRCVRD